MQAPSIMMMSPVSAGSADIAADAPCAGQGIRVSGPFQPKSRESLFAAIFHQGFSLGGSAGLAEGEARLPEGGDDDPVDVCGLLMQLMMMNAPQQPAAEAGEEGGSGEDGAVTGADATAAPGAAAEVTVAGEQAQAASVMITGAAAQDGEAPAKAAAGGAPVQADAARQPAAGLKAQDRAAFAGIASALENEAIAAGTGGAADLAEPQTAPETQTVPAPQDAEAAGGRSITDTPAIQAGIGAKDAPGGPANRAGAGTAAGQAQEAAAVSAAGQAGGGDMSGGGLGLSSRDRDKAGRTEATGTGAAGAPAGTAWAGETAVEKTAAAEKALFRLSEDLRSLESGSHEIRIVLEPESLGVLTITVVKTEAGVSCRIKSEDREVAAAISGQLQKLISSMESKGIRLDDVDVTYAQTDNGAGAQQNDFTRSGSQSSNGHYQQAPDQNQDGEAQDGGFWKEYYTDEKTSDSMVEYRV